MCILSSSLRYTYFVSAQGSVGRVINGWYSYYYCSQSQYYLFAIVDEIQPQEAMTIISGHAQPFVGTLPQDSGGWPGLPRAPLLHLLRQCETAVVVNQQATLLVFPFRSCNKRTSVELADA